MIAVVWGRRHTVVFSVLLAVQFVCIGVALDSMGGVPSFGMTGWFLLGLGAVGSLVVSTLILVKLLDVVRGRGRSPL
jgi:hypothetical protein